MAKKKSRRKSGRSKGWDWRKGLRGWTEGPLDVLSATVAGGIIWSLLLLSTGLLNVATGYGDAFLQMMSGLYPGYRPGALGLLPLTLYGILDGGICAGFLALLYNKIAR